MGVGKLGKWGNGVKTRDKFRDPAVGNSLIREGAAPYMSII